MDNPLDEFGYQDVNHPDYNPYYDAEWVINDIKNAGLPSEVLHELRKHWFEKWNFEENSTENRLAYHEICDVLLSRQSLLDTLVESSEHLNKNRRSYLHIISSRSGPEAAAEFDKKIDDMLISATIGIIKKNELSYGS